MISIQNQLVGAQEGQRMTLECNSEAFPQLINYWTKENNEIIENGIKIIINNMYIFLSIFFLFFTLFFYFDSFFIEFYR